MKKKYFFGWTNFKHVVKQVYLTFSNKSSELSSKRIERAAFVISALVSYHVWFSYHYKKLDYMEITVVMSALLGYAGFTLVKGIQEKYKQNGSNTDKPADKPESN
jgi:DMSO/TMAO reductase YedYZ heme-binding membrane subunit